MENEGRLNKRTDNKMCFKYMTTRCLYRRQESLTGGKSNLLREDVEFLSKIIKWFSFPRY